MSCLGGGPHWSPEARGTVRGGLGLHEVGHGVAAAECEATRLTSRTNLRGPRSIDLSPLMPVPSLKCRQCPAMPRLHISVHTVFRCIYLQCGHAAPPAQGWLVARGETIHPVVTCLRSTAFMLTRPTPASALQPVWIQPVDLGPQKKPHSAVRIFGPVDTRAVLKILLLLKDG